MEQIIREHLQERDELEEYLAVYDGERAVFFDQAPEADDEKWETEGKCCLVLYLERRRDPFRMGTGTLTVRICPQGQEKMEASVPFVKKALVKSLDGYIFTSSKEILMADFRCGGPVAAGETTVFSMTSFPKPTSIAGSPEALLRQWTKTQLPEILGKELFLIGEEMSEGAFLPTEEKPAVCWRTDRIRTCGQIKDWKTASFRTVSVQGHILAPKETSCAADIVQKIDSALIGLDRLEGDDSFILIGRNSRGDFRVDSVRTGQITVEAICPVPAARDSVEKLKNAGFNMR